MIPSTNSHSTSTRVEWIDFGKGICIFMVVMLHTTHLMEASQGGGAGWLDSIVAFAKPFRMPDFFLLSGLLLGRVINRPWKRYLDTKVVHFLYFYVLWETILFVFFFVLGVWDDWIPKWHRTRLLIHEYLYQMVQPFFPLWFIHSLPIYFVVTRAIKKVQPWIVIGVLAILHSVKPATDIMVVDQFCIRYIYFYSGYIFAPHIFRFAEWAAYNRRWAVLYLCAWLVVNQWAVTPPEFADLPLVSLAVGYAGSLAVILAASLLSKCRWTRALKYMGENSIVIYLTFAIPVVIIDQMITRYIPDVGTACLLVTIGAVATSLLLQRAVRNTPARFLYERPSWMKLTQPGTPSSATLPAG
jgi:uncharacterized membrane protein YcfT